MMIKPFILFIFSLLIHPVHVTMSSLTINESGDALIFNLRAYSDDLDLDMLRLYSVEGVIEDEHFFKFTGPDLFYEKYVNDHIKFIINGKVLEASFIHKELLEMETILRFSIPLKNRIMSLEVENKILTGLYPDQVNLFIYKNGEIEEGVRYTVSDTRKRFKPD
ncbi:MAG: hypothetical protein K8R35_02920 [Bacteroidales bacterium]|nr:hypothetical protein [Bacteroidales bacterium]